MNALHNHKTRFGGIPLKVAGLLLCLLAFSIASHAQNTKGDRPLSNQRQVRESKFKAKTQKKGKKAKTKDLAGRRLRTKDKSSASRANASYPQPDPYSKRPRVKNDRPARAQGRVFNSSPKESRTRAWRGDIAGSSIRRVKPSKSEAARNNIYPQRSQYVHNPHPRPSKKPYKVYTRTASGSYPVRIVPSEKQRAWRGDMKGNPVSRPRTASGSVKNVYKQFGKYEKNPARKPRSTERLHYGRSGQADFINYSSPPRPSGKGQGAPASASRSYVKRGKKNVYWGKFSKGEKANTRDITGGPLRTRNYKSTPAGLVGRDTLKFFGKKPLGDQSRKGKKTGGFITTRKGQRAWTGDISGSRLRRSKPKTKQTAGEFFYPRKLSISKSGEAGRGLPGGGFKTRTRQGRVQGSLPPRTPGIGGSAVDKYNSSIKGRKGIKGGGSVSRGWNNKGNPLPPRRSGDGRAAGYQGTFRAGDLAPDFNPQGIGFAGNIKTRRPAKGGGSISGRRWNNNGNPINVRGAGDGSAGAARFQGNFRKGELTPGFTPQGVGFAGNIKTKRPPKGGGSVSGKLWNNKNQPVDVNRAGDGTIRAARFQGSFRKGELSPGFTPQGIGYAGNIKTRRPAKGGGSVSGKLWNNNNQPVDVNEAGKGTVRASQFQGNIKSRRPEKGGGSVSGKLINNNGQPIQVVQAGRGTVRASRFQGNIKSRRPEKGGGSVSGKLINNNGQPIEVVQAGRGTVRASKFQGNLKTRKPEKGGGSVSGEIWNNNEQPIKGEDPTLKDAKMARFTYKEKKPFLKKMYVQNPNSSKESIKKAAPDETTFKVGGLQVKVKEKDYERKPNAARGALPGIAPKGPSLKAAEYARTMKRTWDYKHNPNSADEALDVREPGKANARIGDFQGNIKMSKPHGARLHPDAKFAHGKDDNVKEERTLLTNFKLFWAKLFKKSENQPEHLKEKIRRPRYDKREQGLWYD